MKKLQFLSYLFAALFMVTMVSCDDDDDDNVDPTASNTELLTAGVWTGNKVFFNGNDVTELAKDQIDVSTTTVKFETNGTYTGTIPGRTEASGTWEFTNDESQVIMDSGTDNELTVDINMLSATELWAEGEFLGENQGVYEVRFVR